MKEFIEGNKKQIEELTKYIEENKSTRDDLIMILHQVQDLFGYIPEEIIIFLSEKLETPAARIYGVVTFYSHFSLEKKGKYVINVCMGTACFVKGAEDILNEFKKQLNVEVGQTTEDGLFYIDALRCVGTCGIAPVVSINGKVYPYVKKEDVKKILSEYKEEVK